MFEEENIAHRALDIKATRLSTDTPFLWASVYYMPMYNDNRIFLAYPNYRRLITDFFAEKLKETGETFDVIAGTSTAGIPWASILAHEAEKRLIYVRDKPKEHGLRNQIEGIDADSDLNRKRVILIEDLISTGGSSVKAVEAIRKANGICNRCISIFDYGFSEADKLFGNMNPPCDKSSLLTYGVLLKVAREVGYINSEQEEMLREWRLDPFGWGTKRGFPKVEK